MRYNMDRAAELWRHLRPRKEGELPYAGFVDKWKFSTPDFGNLGHYMMYHIC